MLNELISDSEEVPENTVYINGVQIDFPFPVYPIQHKFMECVINALDNKQNAMLESPTGTGKTLSLLCATLSWMRHQKNKVGWVVRFFMNLYSRETQKVKNISTSESMFQGCIVS